MQVQNTPHFAAVQTEGALYPLMRHQEHDLQCAMLLGQGIPKILAKGLLFWECPSPWALSYT
jgi:hypothetical protein